MSYNITKCFIVQRKGEYVFGRCPKTGHDTIKLAEYAIVPLEEYERYVTEVREFRQVFDKTEKKSLRHKLKRIVSTYLMKGQ